MQERNITDILEKYDIEYWTEGKNVTEGWVNVKCPFCNDHSNHMGIDPATLLYSCWRCRESGHFVWLIHKLTGIQVEYINRMLDGGLSTFKKDFADEVEELFKPKAKPVNKADADVVFPEHCYLIDHETKSNLLDYYLNRRNISRDTLINNYCLICEAGYYKMRIIIPVFYGSEVVSWQAADMTGTAHEKYRTAPGPRINNYLYKCDEVDNIMVVTEGILDQWRMGYGSVCSFGTSLTTRQKVLIKNKNLDVLVFAWDGEAYDYAKANAEEMAPYIKDVRVAQLPYGVDPDKLGYEDCWKLVDKAESI